MRAWKLFLFLVTVAVSAALDGCSTSAVGVDDCNAIEDALCNRAAAMNCPGIDLLQPSPAQGNSTADQLAACIRYYSIACLHGLLTTKAPMKEQVTACVDAINSDASSCYVIENPQYAPDNACSWLVPPEAGTDAEADAADVGAGDATPDALIDAGAEASAMDAPPDAPTDGGNSG